MKDKISQVEIGRRIATLRKLKGWSQEDLSRNIGMSRPSLAQIELGNRNLDIMEIQKLSDTLGFSIDEFMTPNYNPDPDQTGLTKKTAREKADERISVPKLSVEKFKHILLYILERCAGKPNVGETVLYKLLYFADFNYYELYEEHLTGANYKKLQFGPVPQRLDSIISNMIEAGQLQRLKTEYFDKTQTRYIPLVKPDLQELKASEKDVIDRVIEQMSDWSATAISDYSHKDIPWLATEDGKDINYELAFYRELPYSVRMYDDNDE